MSETKIAVFLAVFALAVLPSAAFAGPPEGEQLPKGTAGTKAPASEGETELEGQGAFEAAPEAPVEEESTDTTNFEIAAGGIANTGNSRNLSITGSTKFLLRRGDHQFSTGAAGNYGRAALADQDEMETVATNVQGRVRYDYFFYRKWMLFFGTSVRHDPFQGLDLRLNAGPGIGYHFLLKPKHRLWAELGYDFQYDLRDKEAIVVVDDAGDPVLDENGEIEMLDRHAYRHAVRLFLGYSNNINEHVTFDTGLEYLQSVLKLRQFRVNYDLGLTVQLAEKFALNTTFSLRLDNAPLPDVKTLDTTTSISLVYRFL